jgi:hypothetical protein
LRGLRRVSSAESPNSNSSNKEGVTEWMAGPVAPGLNLIPIDR